MEGDPLKTDRGGSAEDDRGGFPKRTRRDGDGRTYGTGGIPGVIGLCSTCEVADTCTCPKPEGGVWRCEFYR